MQTPVVRVFQVQKHQLYLHLEDMGEMWDSLGDASEIQNELDLD